MWDGRFASATPCPKVPVIGVLCCNEFAQRPIQAVATRFIVPLTQLAGAAVVLIPAVAEACNALALVDRLDGLLLTGSRSNVAGERYAAKRPDDGPTDFQRDEVALALAARMIEAGRPVFGICRGLQELNVLFGGSLIDTRVAHHCGLDDGADYDRHFDYSHAIDLVAGGTFNTAGDHPREVVNSVHRQGIDRLGSGLKIDAIAADDGLVEAFSARPCGGDVLAVQWHPEWDVGTSVASGIFFARLGTALAEV